MNKRGFASQLKPAPPKQSPNGPTINAMAELAQEAVVQKHSCVNDIANTKILKFNITFFNLISSII
jgi:hypothetical protein